MASTKYIEEAEKRAQTYENMRKTQADEQTALVNKNADDAIARAERDTTTQIQDADRSYIEMINDADIQKELDIRDIRETRANMGISRSGLASTEVTAATLSAGNKTAAAQRQRQSAIDTLKQSLLDYKANTEAERNAQNLNIKQASDMDILDYKDTWSKWGMENDMRVDENDEANRRSGILSLDIPDDIKSEAIEKGLTVSQAAAMGKLVAEGEENKRRLELQAGKEAGLYSQEVYDRAIVTPGATREQAKVWQNELNAEQAQEATSAALQFADSMLSAKLIDPATYVKAKAEGWSEEEIAKAAEDASTNAENTRLGELKAAFDANLISKDVYDLAVATPGTTLAQAKVWQNENAQAAADENQKFALAMLESGAIDPALCATATRANWDPETLTTQMQKNATNIETARNQSLDAACSSGIISEYIRDYAKVNGLTLEQAKLAQTEMNSQNANAENEAEAEALETNRQILDNLYDKDETKTKLSGSVYTLAYTEGWDPSFALEVERGYRGASDKRDSGGVEAAVQYLKDNYNNDYYAFSAICTLLGITNEDVERYSQSEVGASGNSSFTLPRPNRSDLFN